VLLGEEPCDGVPTSGFDLSRTVGRELSLAACTNTLSPAVRADSCRAAIATAANSALMFSFHRNVPLL
jgi:hypothetical protein